MYVSTHIVTGAAEHFVTLPRSAISFNPFGATVFIVEKDGKVQDKLIAKQTFVTTGETRGDQVAILAGVKEGDTVVTSGQIKLRHGSTVIINNSVQPSNDPAPKPIDN
jgi:membrane fusion protein (multidrug efflux system)